MMYQTYKKTYVIAEMACSHDGKVELAKNIIKGAGIAGANAIQFQIWSLKDMVVPYHPDYKKIESIALNYDEWRELSEFTRKNYPNLEIIACVYERNSVNFAETINVNAYKIHSADLSNPYLVKYVASKGKRIDLSVGSSTLQEIQNALEWIRGEGLNNIWLMYGYQNFPTPTDAINLRYMMKLKSLFEVPVGYQDHSDADNPSAFRIPAAAMGAGVDIIEKHITHDRSKKGVDHEAALNPDEFLNFTSMVREIELAMGCSTPRPFNEHERKYRKYSKKSIVAGEDLKKGNVITEDKLLFMRTPEIGVPPDMAFRFKGKSLKRDIDKYNLIGEEDFL